MTPSQIAKVLSDQPIFAVTGAPLDTGNLGVSALCLSMIEAVHRRQPDWTPVLLDYSRGVVTSQLRLSDQRTIELIHIGTSSSRRFWRTDNLMNITLCQTLGLPHSALAAMRNAKGLLDISGGDSFTDLYGPARFADVTDRKRIAIKAGAKLILMPQTYGPYSTAQTQHVARELIAGSKTAWARDPDSFERLENLMQGTKTSCELRQGVDVAFGLPCLEPTGELKQQVESWANRPETIVGINISGLIYNGGESARQQYGLAANYRELIDGLVRKFLDDPTIRVVFVPHVVPQRNPLESDTIASKELFSKLPKELQARVEILPEMDDPRIAKWAISHCDWFCGTRMHATIAALSTRVPVGALAYSLKTKGVFDTCECGDCVVELRDAAVDEAISGMWECYQKRDELRARLQRSMAIVSEQVEQQADDIVATMTGQLISEAIAG